MVQHNHSNENNFHELNSSFLPQSSDQSYTEYRKSRLELYLCEQEEEIKKEAKSIAKEITSN